MSGVKRTWQQVKVKYKNILQNAARKKTATAATGGGPPVAALTPAEDLALQQNSRRPIIVGIEGGTSSDPVCSHDTQPYVKVVGGVLNLLDPPVFDNDESKIREIYKMYLLQEIECKKADLQYKKLKIRKLELEIKKMEKDAQQDDQ
ncbi:uncharacterized protein LOC143517263 [Brachyhypopomus gauderio]|uniref:uncharacterized protein LOC143517263 n=1 Tax=Brachyhypopomus gauderio TaxID=698409 RepID=UPI0040413053